VAGAHARNQETRFDLLRGHGRWCPFRALELSGAGAFSATLQILSLGPQDCGIVRGLQIAREYKVLIVNGLLGTFLTLNQTDGQRLHLLGEFSVMAQSKPQFLSHSY